MAAASDPYQYFRMEAKELLGQMSQGVLEMEKGGQTPELLSRLLRWAHTLKGAARVVKQNEISQIAHDFETTLEPFRSGAQSSITSETVNRLLKLIDSMSDLVKKLDLPTSAQATGTPSSDLPKMPSADDHLETIRLPIGEMDAIFDGISEAIVQVDGLKQTSAALAMAIPVRSDQQDLETRIDRLERQLHKMRGHSSEHRLLPANVIFPVLQRTARDAAEELEKKVEFVGMGGETHLDAHVLASIRGVLIQIVRNSVAHGIEKETARVGRGKPASGTIRVKVERRGNKIGFVCEDDGQGIDTEAIRKAALESGEGIPVGAAFGVQEAVELIKKGGISTAGVTTEVSGRGVGLNLVWDTVKRLKGDFSVQSKPGSGICIDICVPSSLEYLHVLQVKAFQSEFSLPFDSISRVVWVGPQDVVHSSEGETILYEGQTLTYLPLDKLIGTEPAGSPSRRKPKRRIAIILKTRAERVALGVDEITGATHVIVKPLSRLAGHHPWIAGAFLDVSGNPRLVMEPDDLIPVLSARSTTLLQSPMKKRSILVVDDSLTSRMLEQSILESAGYEVKAAASAEEALKRIEEFEFCLFVVDVEMPGMNGFEFIERTRSDAKFSGIPAVLVTSRASPEDRERGKKAGARAHIMKSEFNEGGFLRTIQNLIG